LQLEVEFNEYSSRQKLLEYRVIFGIEYSSKAIDRVTDSNNANSAEHQLKLLLTEPANGHEKKLKITCGNKLLSLW